MEIKITKAAENNLKDFSVAIPVNRMTAITGISGSGKSSLLKNVLASEGAQRYSCMFSRAATSSLASSKHVRVQNIENLPLTLLVDTKCSITNSMSTVSTVSGLHEALRSLFVDFGETICPRCNTRQEREGRIPSRLLAEIVCDDRYDRALDYLRAIGSIRKERFYDSSKKLLNARGRKARFSEVFFDWNCATPGKIRQFNQEFQSTILVDAETPYNPLRNFICSHCGTLLPRLIRSRFSFMTPFDDGGGMCRCCSGTGDISSPNSEAFISDARKSILDGGIRFVSDKGIKYTNISGGDLKSIVRYLGINVKEPLGSCSSESMKALLHGIAQPISISIGHGKKKEIPFPGVIGALQKAFVKGRGASALSSLFAKGVCPSCNGVRFDPAVDCFRLFGKRFSDFMHMTIAELDAWGDAILPNVPKPAANQLRRIIRKTTAFRRVVCGHLSLDRKSSTLSGGELQRIRICSLLNANVTGVCYLLDEPSTGLHDVDIESLTGLLKDLCQNGNTVVMVEHNPKMIRSCDWIVDIGPGSGDNGGNLLFSDWTQNIKAFNTSTALVLKDPIHFKYRNNQEVLFKKWLAFDHLNANNLRDLSIRLPYGAFSAVCGVSGSGKTTFLRDVLNARIAKNPQLFGFSSVVYLSQRSTSFPYTSTVATQLSCFDIVTKLFSKGLRIKPSCFLPNSSDGKCESCSGRRELLSEDGNIIGLCPECNGRGYSVEVLQATVSNVSFHELMETPLSEVGNKLCVPELSRLSSFCDLLGIGHLTFSRRSNTLSQGELQRLHIANALSQNIGEDLFLLDEPSKGLHASDAEKLVDAIRLLVDAGNTVVAVEHNLPVILGSDYIVELGGAGMDGGRLLFNDYTKSFSKANTPTSRLLSDFFRPLRPRPSTNGGKSCIAFSTDGSIRRFPANSVHRPTDSSNIIKRLSLSTNADFLATAIPGNPLFSRVGGSGEDEIIVSSPVVYSIDFAETSKFPYSLYGMFGLRDAIITSVMASNPAVAGLLQYVFNDESPTGKCSFCGGRGSAAIIPESCFVDGSRLTNDCISFLKNSGSFQAVQTWFNHSKHFHLSDSLDKLDDSGKRILFYGWEGTEEHAFPKSGWLGLITFFLRNHSYYPNRSAENIYSKRIVSLCPICKGRRLDQRHSSLTIDGGLSYKAIMTNSFDWLLKRANEASSGWLKECRQTLQLVCESGLGSLKPENHLCDLNAPSAGMVRLVSIGVRGYVQSGIALFNVDALSPNHKTAALKLAKNIARRNTVFIC